MGEDVQYRRVSLFAQVSQIISTGKGAKRRDSTIHTDEDLLYKRGTYQYRLAKISIKIRP